MAWFVFLNQTRLHQIRWLNSIQILNEKKLKRFGHLSIIQRNSTCLVFIKSRENISPKHCNHSIVLSGFIYGWILPAHHTYHSHGELWDFVPDTIDHQWKCSSSLHMIIVRWQCVRVVIYLLLRVFNTSNILTYPARARDHVIFFCSRPDPLELIAVLSTIDIVVTLLSLKLQLRPVLYHRHHHHLNHDQTYQPTNLKCIT